MGKHFKYTKVQGKFLLDNIDIANKELAKIFEEKFKVNIDLKYLANFKFRVKKKKITANSFNTKIGDSYVNKDSKMSEEISAEVKENVNLFRGLAKRGIRR